MEISFTILVSYHCKKTFITYVYTMFFVSLVKFKLMHFLSQYARQDRPGFTMCESPETLLSH